jgi:hypothetical protein
MRPCTVRTPTVRTPPPRTRVWVGWCCWTPLTIPALGPRAWVRARVLPSCTRVCACVRRQCSIDQASHARARQRTPSTPPPTHTHAHAHTHTHTHAHTCKHRLPQLAARPQGCCCRPPAARARCGRCLEHRRRAARGKLVHLCCRRCHWGVARVGGGAPGSRASAVPRQAAAAVFAVQQQRPHAGRDRAPDHTGVCARMCVCVGCGWRLAMRVATPPPHTHTHTSHPNAPTLCLPLRRTPQAAAVALINLAVFPSEPYDSAQVRRTCVCRHVA